MATKLTVEKLNDADADKWDRFVLGRSVNGTILQTRRFLSYHPEGRFEDTSLVLRRGTEIVGVVPAAHVVDGCVHVFASHPGSTFGGIITSREFLSAEAALEMVSAVDEWIRAEGFGCAVLKMTPNFFCRKESSSLEYALQHVGYTQQGELSFVIDYADFAQPVENNFSARRRRDCRYGERAGCQFVRLQSDEEVADFYRVLKLSLTKYDTDPVHALDELLDFKNTRLRDECRFYGVLLDGQLIAGSMVFTFGRDVFHTQYLAADPEHLDCFPMNYLDWNLIRTAKEEGFSKFSFGISTEDHGRVLNTSLARFKDGFGCGHSINRTFTKLMG